MTVNKYATAAGKKYEADLMKYLRSKGYEAERLRLTGAEDEGDLVMKTMWGRYIIEAKRTKSLDLSGWVRQAELERNNYVEHRRGLMLNASFVVIHYARNKGLGGSYVTTTLDEWLGR